jgi:50S ribosomal protein L16 3-hydroxylase
MTALLSTASVSTQPTPLLGGLTPAQFMQRHWQKKPLLIRQAMPGVRPPVDRQTLMAMAAKEGVESRLIVQNTTAPAKKSAPQQAPWTLRKGPFPRRAFPPLTQPGWTLLVQSLDLHVPEAHDLLQPFRFIPDARLDDLMMSFATEGGGVGPHYDSYDVFLLQVHGRRRWRVGRMQDSSLLPDVPLKILQHFEPEEEWVLEPGDMLYLPPQWAHDGIAEGECMTCSIGFRAPDQVGLAAELLLRMADATDCADQNLYRDPKQEATVQPACIPAALQVFAKEAVHKIMNEPHALNSALGEIMTEPKPSVWFEPGSPLMPGQGVRLNPASRMLYDDRCVYLNGESWRASAHQGRVLRLLADQRSLSANQLSRISADLQALFDQWLEDGWLLPALSDTN